MSKGLEALDRTIERLQNGEKIIVRDYIAIEKELKSLEILMKDFKVSVYHTRHNETGWEMCVQDLDGKCIYKQITESEYELFKEILVND